MHTNNSIIVFENKANMGGILSNAITDNKIYSYKAADTFFSYCSKEEDVKQLDSNIIVIDLFFEDVDGLTLIENIRIKNNNAFIIAFTTTEAMQELELEPGVVQKMAERCGANIAFIAPFNLAEIIQAIRNQLATSCSTEAAEVA